MEDKNIYDAHTSVIQFHYQFVGDLKPYSLPSLSSLEEVEVEEYHCTWPGPPIEQQSFGRHPIHATCPSCKADVVTKVKSEFNFASHLLTLTRFVCCFIPRVCFTRCMTPYQSSIHTCPDCSTWIGGSSRPE